MADRRFLPALLGQYALACNLTSFYYMITMGDGLPGWFFPQVMLVYAPAVYLLNRLFLRRERTMLAVSVLNLLLCIGSIAAYLLLERWRGIAYFAFVAIFMVWLTLRGVQNALKGSALRSTLLTLDASFLTFVAFIGYASAAGLEIKWCIPALSGLCAAIFAAASLRSARPLGAKSLVAMGSAFAVLLLLLWLILGAAAPAGHGLVAFWNLLASGVNAVKGLILRGIVWLLSLLPNAAPGEMGWAEFEDYTQQVEELPAEEVSPVLGMIFLFIVVLGGLALLVWLIRRLHSIRLRSMGGETLPSLPKRERTPILQGLIRLICSWIDAVRLRVRLWRGRNTAAGLYFLLVHRSRRAPWHKRPSETPREFLLRLAASAGEDEPLAAALRDMAAETDAALYSGRPAHGKLGYASMIRRKIGLAARKQFIRQFFDKLRPKQTEKPAVP